MLEEAPDELQDLEDHGPRPVASGLLIADEDLVVFDLDDSVVGYGHPEDVGREVFDRGL